jgi:hypothetical protein
MRVAESGVLVGRASVCLFRSVSEKLLGFVGASLIDACTGHSAGTIQKTYNRNEFEADEDRVQAWNSDIADFSRREITMLGRTKPVLLTGATGPAVIVIHEVYGFTPTLARFCRWVCDAGFRVYAPILFGSPDAGNTEKQTLGRVLSLCLSRELTLLAANQQLNGGSWPAR